MKQYIITEYPELVRKYLVNGKSKKDAYNNFLEDKIIKQVGADEYEAEYQPLEIEEVTQWTKILNNACLLSCLYVPATLLCIYFIM